MIDREIEESYQQRRLDDDPAIQFLREGGGAAGPGPEKTPAPPTPTPTPPAGGRTLSDLVAGTPATPPARGVLGTAGAVVGDVVKGVVQAPAQIVGGVRDAVVETGQALNTLSDWMETTVPGWKSLNRGKLKVRLGEVATSDGVTSNLIRSASQFLTGFIPGMQATKAVGITNLVVRGAAAGAVADAVVFDPHGPRVSNLVNTLAPALRNPVTEYLAAKPEDSDAEGRLKNTLEGLGLGTLAEGVFVAARSLRRAQLTRRVERAEARATALESPGVELPAPAPATPPRAVGAEVLAEEVTPLADLAATYKADVDVARRGTRTHAQAAAEAAELGTTLEDVRAILPGTAVNDTEAVAVVKLMVDHGQQVKALARSVVEGDESAVRPFMASIFEHAQLDPKRLGVIAESGRTLSVFNEPVSGMNRFLKQFSDLFERTHGQVTPQRLAGLVDAMKTPEQLAGFARDLAKPDAVDMLIEYFVNNLLWSPATHAANMASNAFTVLWAPAERALAARIGSGEIARGEAVRMLYGIVTSQWEALRMASLTAWTGESASGLTKVEVRHRAITGDNLDLTGPFGRALDFLAEVTRVPLARGLRAVTTGAGEVFRLPGRALLTADEYFRVINYRAELNALAWREGMETATSEGLSGAARGRRAAQVMEQIRRDPPASIKRDAENFASYQTFTKALGEPGSHIMGALDAYPLGRLAVPFYRTPVNLAKYGVERMPIAFLADYPILRSLMPDIAADLRAGGAKRDLVLAKASLGSAVMAVTATLAASGYITGRGPADANVRREWLETHQPYSGRGGDAEDGTRTWYAFNRLDAPVGMIMGLAADAADALGNLPPGERDDLAMVLAYAVGRNLTSKTYLKSVSEALNALADPERFGTNPARNLVAGMVPFSSLLASIERTDDPTLREARTLLDHVLARIPGLSETLPPRRNLYGEPIALTGGLGPDIASPIYTKSATPNPVSDEMVRLRLSVDMPPKAIERIALTAEEHDRFIVLAGREVELGGLGLKARLQQVIHSATYRRLGDDDQAMLLRNWIHEYRQVAQAQLGQEFPELGEAVRRAQRERSRRQRTDEAPERAGPSGMEALMRTLSGTLGR